MPLTLKNFYKQGWAPGANTIVYYPLNGDLNDYSGNGRNLTGSNITYSSGGPGQVAEFGTNSTAYYINNSLFNKSYPFTYLCYINSTDIPTTYYAAGIPYRAGAITITNGTTLGTFDKYLGFGAGGVYAYNYYNQGYSSFGGTIQSGEWCLISYAFDGSYIKVYINGNLEHSTSCPGSYTGYSQAAIRLGHQLSSTDCVNFKGKLSNVVVEDKARTDAEILDYYNKTKSLYGIS